jgi:hypothetical protein
LGFGPYWLAGWLSCTKKTRRKIQPTTGMRPMRSHQPERPVSCRRLAPTASVGTRRASWRRPWIGPVLLYGPPRIPKMASRAPPTALTIAVNRKKNQYSERRARATEVGVFPLEADPDGVLERHDGTSPTISTSVDRRRS